MKKLSLQKGNNSQECLAINDFISFIEFGDGYSCFSTIQGNKIRGACCKCKYHYCSSYGEQELSSVLFRQFPKNSSLRVCPTNAIRFNDDGLAYITDDCINCGLCVYRCPFAAIQYSPSRNFCRINDKISMDYVPCSEQEQLSFIHKTKRVPRRIEYKPITIPFSELYTSRLRDYVSHFPDISEIVVRNTFLNLGAICNVNAKGNNHIRIEFFAEVNENVVIGESEITSSDTLSVIRRILDDVAVLNSRYKVDIRNIIPLSVINGLPNKRTDYYEVIKDVKQTLGIQIYTITYHILYMLHLYQVELSEDVLCGFIIDQDNMNLVKPTKKAIRSLIEKDLNLITTNYIPTK